MPHAFVTTHAFVTLDVFTEQRFGGNPLAVFPDASGLSPDDMQALAREFNLSETSFVLPPDNPAHTARVRIFNTSHEMDFAGHPNVGTAMVLAEQGRDVDGVLLFEEPAGLVEVRVERAAGGRMRQAIVAAPLPLSVAAVLPAPLIAGCCGLQPGEIRATGHPPLLASTGNPLVLAEVDAAALSRASPDLGQFRHAVSAHPELAGRLGIYLYTQEPSGIRARLFSPLDGTWEDPATGSAATTLAALLLSLTAAPHAAWQIRQGIEMGRPSLLHAEARHTEGGIRASVGGACVPVLRGEALL